ncbi:DUF4573 domain-containing protein [Kribbella sp. NPDC050281]|uniref:DUF4573 domain-containing protein n=1 Tax=Kribbella sp. NPDC050281 TaxID=3155515 RepID=UPI0033C3432B
MRAAQATYRTTSHPLQTAQAIHPPRTAQETHPPRTARATHLPRTARATHSPRTARATHPRRTAGADPSTRDRAGRRPAGCTRRAVAVVRCAAPEGAGVVAGSGLRSQPTLIPL